MKSKIIKKILSYANEHEIFDLAITKKNDHHILWANTALTSHQIKIPAKLEADLGNVFRHLLSLAPDELISGAYFKTEDTKFNISIIPDGEGEKIIIKVIPKTTKLLPLSHLGLGRNERKVIENFLRRQRGLIIIGAGNSQGKTTTLYSLLQKIDKEKRACYLLADKQELELDAINYLSGPTANYQNGLEHILKSDSEVIAIDDIPDKLIGEAAYAAKTGRLIIATTRAENISELSGKIKSLSLNEDLPILLIFEKLLMKNCPHCLQAYVIREDEELIEKYWPADKKYKPKYFFTSHGCPKCNHSGVSGQIASFNLTQMNNQEINFFSSLASDVMYKAANGLISMGKFIAKHQSAKIKKL